MATKLSSIYLDGGYEINFMPEITEYTILIPDGRPRIPRVFAIPAENGKIKVTQAALPDNASESSAYIDAEDADGNTAVYKVTFKKDRNLGFQLQYADRYRFIPKTEADNITFESENPEILSVDGSGVIMAKRISEKPIKVCAKTGEKIADTLMVDKVVRAPVNIFLITGQSNAYGTYDIPDGISKGEFSAGQTTKTICPDAGTVFCLDVDNVGGFGTIYDLAQGRSGFSPALGKRWYELTGEKTIMLQTAVGGAPIEAWMKPDENSRYTYGNIKSNFYETTLKGYNYIINEINADGSGFELNKVYAFWLQGETGMASTYNPDKDGKGIGNWEFGDTSHILSSGEYYNAFMKNMRYFKEDFGCEFMGILLVRAVYEVVSEESRKLQLYTDLVPARAAQYTINYTTGTDIAIVSRVCDIARTCSYEDKTDVGYGLMGCNNVHYNQTGHNKNGLEAAENTYKLLFGREEKTAEDIEIIACDGRKRFADGETLNLKAGERYQISAVVQPLYTDTKGISFEIADKTVCGIDKFGMITADPCSAGKQTTLTAKCEKTSIRKQITISVS